MDTITVNQKNQNDVVATVQSIPDIFRDAERTIAIREGDSHYECCLSIPDSQLATHMVNEHNEDSWEESYLKRLWTLQEILLSHTVQFAICRDGQEPQYVLVLALTDELLDLTVERSRKNFVCELSEVVRDFLRVNESLHIVAWEFVSSSGAGDKVADMRDFKSAYLNEGTVSRQKTAPRTLKEDIFSAGLPSSHIASERSASMPRDYIFATMPQFPWYQYPADAQQMSFQEIFADLGQQARFADHQFTGKFLRSMLEEPSTLSRAQAWALSRSQPEPTCLGDFFKLLGNQCGDGPKALHFISNVEVHRTPTDCDGSALAVLQLIQDIIDFDPDPWALSHRGNELSRYGSYPEDDGRLENMREFHNNLLKKGEDATGTGLLASISQEVSRRSSPEWLYIQTLRVLDLMFCNCDRFQHFDPLKVDWVSFSREMEDKWIIELQDCLLLGAAIVACRLPLSAFHWIEARFVPVVVQLQDRGKCIGLLSKLSRSKMLVRLGEAAVPAVLIGWHPSGDLRGKDIMLLDPGTWMPVGMVPDFLSNTVESPSQETICSRLTMLYGENVMHTSDKTTSVIAARFLNLSG